jgi:superkiller protein 3
MIIFFKISQLSKRRINMIHKRHPAALLLFLIGCLCIGGTSVAIAAVKQARNAYKNKDYKKAIELARQAIKDNPNDLATYKVLVKANKKQGTLNKILGEFANRLVKEPGNAVYQYVAAYIYDLKGNSQRAERGYQKALSIDPEISMANYNLGYLYIEKKEMEKAIPFFKKELEINPGHSDTYIQLGRSYYKNKQYPKAIAVLEKLLAKNPGNKKANDILGHAYYDMGERQKALNKWRATVKLDPQDIESGEHNVIGLLYDRKGFYHNAIKEFQKGIKNNPRNVRLYNNLGLALMHKVNAKTFGKREKRAREAKYIKAAIDAFKKALEINPKFALAYLNLGEAYEAHGQTSQSLELFEKYVEIRPSDVNGLNRLGIAYKLLGQYDNATKVFEKAIKRNPKHAIAHRNLGEVYYYQGNQEAALIQWNISLQLNPQQPSLRERIDTGFWKGK